jgi:hypothetical protein
MKPATRAVYNVGGTVLLYSTTERILGVHVSSDLRWNAHTDIARGKAAKVLSFEPRNLHVCNPRVKRLAYQARPYDEAAHVVRHPRVVPLHRGSSASLNAPSDLCTGGTFRSRAKRSC